MTATIPHQTRLARFFGHPLPSRPRTVLDDTTRRLCAASYLDDDYAHEVVSELTEDEQRAVPPSYGFDVGPVLRHAFRARRRLLIRDIVLSALLLAGIILLPGVTLAWVLVAYGWRQLRPKSRGSQRPGRWTAATVLFGCALVVVVCCSFASPLLLMAPAVQPQTSYYGDPYGDPYGGGTTTPGSTIAGLFGTMLLITLAVLPVFFAAGTAGTLIMFRYRTYRTLVDTLAPRRRTAPPAPPNQRIAQRLAWLDGAQRGNVIMHSKNPLMGAGNVVTGWSITLTLRGRPVAHDGNSGNSANAGPVPSDREAPFDTQRVSPTAMRDVLTARISKLGDSQLPARARVPGILVMDQIVADGERRHNDPLIDPQRKQPLHQASPEAIVSIIEHPQGGVRHYLRAAVGTEGKVVHSPDGAQVLLAQNQEIAVSAFVHIAVEGGKLYAEFLGTVLPPIKRKYHLVDKLRPNAGPLFARAVVDALPEWLDSVVAPYRVLRALRQIVTTAYNADTARRSAHELLSYDHGARLSVRELAAEPAPATFLQELDARKYLKLVEKTVLEALLDYLDDVGVDTSEYRAQMNVIQNNQTVFANSTFNGPTAVGVGAMAMQRGESR
jgi:hypothetical protein